MQPKTGKQSERRYDFAEASPEERAIGRAAQAQGWPTDGLKAKFDTDAEDGPLVLVHTQYGIAKLLASEGGSFKVGAYYNAKTNRLWDVRLPDEIKQPGMSYGQFLDLARAHHLDEPRPR